MVDVTRLGPAAAVGAVEKHADQKAREEGQQRHKPPPKPAPRESVKDVAFVMGIPVEELTPKVEEALRTILNEFDHQRLQIEHLQKQIEGLEKKATSHSFLPVLNRAALLRELARIMGHAERGNLTNSFVMIHIANAEAVRRRHGHDAAKAMLEQAVRGMWTGLGEAGVVGGLGGSDFGIILLMVDGPTAAEKVRGLVRQLAGATLDFGDGPEAPAADFGIYEIKAGDTPEDVVLAADRDLLERLAEDRTGG